MPIHDWTRVDAGLFHDFHQSWTVTLRNALNNGRLPSDYFALVEQRIQGPVPHVLTLTLATGDDEREPGAGGVAVAVSPPRTRVIRRGDPDIYAKKANLVTVRHRHGDVVAVIEIISPGNKGSRSEFRALVQKSAELIGQGVHLLLVDLFPPGPRDPQGIHKPVWDELFEEPFELPPDKRLTLASYDAGPPPVAYVELAAVGDVLPELPLFLKPEYYIPAPLELSYQNAWHDFPNQLKGLLDGR